MLTKVNDLLSSGIFMPNSSLELGWAERAVEWGKTGILSLAEHVKMGFLGDFSPLPKPSHVL